MRFSAFVVFAFFNAFQAYLLNPPLGIPKSKQQLNDKPIGGRTISLAAPQVKSPQDDDNWPFTLSRDLTMEDYLQNNRDYVESIHENYGNAVFDANSKGQEPHTLWISCSDLRAGEACLAALPGEIFTHRNIANVINANDISLQGIIQYAVDVLKVRKIIVCGHTDCGGVAAALSSSRLGGVLDYWINPVRQVRASNTMELQGLKNHKDKVKRLAEFNVIASATAIKRHPSASAALRNGDIEVWGMMYDVSTGLLSEVPIPPDKNSDSFQLQDEAI